MARPKGSKNKPRAGLDEQGGIGHNSSLSDVELQALHFRHTRDYKQALDAKKKADALLKNVCKVIKAENGNLKSIKLSIQLETPEGEESLRSEMSEKLRIARWNGLDPGFQGNLFEATDMAPAVDRAAAAGLRAGMKGESPSCPHDLSTPQGQAYMENYHKGQELLLRSGIKNMEPEDEDEGDDFDDALDGRNADTKELEEA